MTYHYHYTTVCYDFDNLSHNADRKLYTSMRKSHHSLHSFLPPIKEYGHYLREMGYPYELPNCCYTFTWVTLSYVLCIIFVSNNWILCFNFYWFFKCFSNT